MRYKIALLSLFMSFPYYPTHLLIVNWRCKLTGPPTNSLVVKQNYWTTLDISCCSHKSVKFCINFDSTCPLFEQHTSLPLNFYSNRQIMNASSKNNVTIQVLNFVPRVPLNCCFNVNFLTYDIKCKFLFAPLLSLYRIGSWLL